MDYYRCLAEQHNKNLEQEIMIKMDELEEYEIKAFFQLNIEFYRKSLPKLWFTIIIVILAVCVSALIAFPKYPENIIKNIDFIIVTCSIIFLFGFIPTIWNFFERKNLLKRSEKLRNGGIKAEIERQFKKENNKSKIIKFR